MLVFRAASIAMINLSEITVRGLLFAHWIMGTLESRFSTVVICILNKSASIRSAVYTIVINVSLLLFQFYSP